MNGRKSARHIGFPKLHLSLINNIRTRQRGKFKTLRREQVQVRDVPEKYWDFAVELAVEYRNHIATRKLGWRTPNEYYFGDTPDISIFRFLVYEDQMLFSPNQTSLARAGLF